MLCMMNHILISKHYSIIALIETLRIPNVFLGIASPSCTLLAWQPLRFAAFGPFGVDMWNRRSGGQSILA